MYGRFDLARLHSACATLRNCFVGFRGGAYSRAGTAFCGFSKQTGRSYPPKLVPFQFSINQGLALEFGNFYMRVISDGGFVVDYTVAIAGASQTNPCILTLAPTLFQLASANSLAAGVTQSYVPLDTVTLAGGVFVDPGIVSVTNTQLAALGLNAPGTGNFAPSDTVHLTGGTQSTSAVLTVETTQVVSASLVSGGSGGPNGAHVVTGTTGTGVKFQISVGIVSGTITEVFGITLPGQYSVNPSNPNVEPVSLPGLTGASFDIKLGISTFEISTPGVFTANASGGTFTQASSSGTGTGATFQNAVFAPNQVAVVQAGQYSTEPSNPVAQASTSGTGLGATFNATFSPLGGTTFNNGDWIAVSGVLGMTQLNGQTFVAKNPTATTVQLTDVYGNNIDATAFSAYISGGTASRIFTLATPYSEVDLDYLKFTQSADVMSLGLVNQETSTEYAPLDLNRLSDSDWTLTSVVPAPTVLPPTNASAAYSTSGSWDYQYVVTAVNPNDGTESIASNIAEVDSAVDIASTAGIITVSWSPSATENVNEYNIYKATPAYEASPPVGSLFGYAGSAYGTQFQDPNIVADFSQVPPTHQNPFARGQLLGVNVLTSSGTVTSVTLAITTSTGSGAVLSPVIVSSELVAIIVLEPGQNYQPTNTITVTVNGGGSATASLNVGPESGTYPGLPFYFQERRGYAFSLNDPDTYWMSQPGSFTNFDFRVPPIDSDSITGSPWAVEVNGIQFAVLTSGGLLILTGLSVWLLVGAGTFATNVQPISPSSQLANPQPEIGCSSTVPPVKIDYDVIYLSSKDSIYYDLPYQLYALSTPIEITVNSSHLFVGFQILNHAWCREPNKVLWAVRDDGTMLSLTWLKPEQVAGWARHDTQGSFVSTCSVTEPPVDALYVATQRNFGLYGNAYIIERMDDRIWPSIEDCWCVDCGFALPQPEPNATLTPSSATGLGSITGVTNLVGGTKFSAATTATVVDDDGKGPGTGAAPTLTIVGGVITAVTFAPGNQGQNYINPAIWFSDPAGSAGGSGASAKCVLNNAMTFTASAAVFSSANIGSFIRCGGGKAQITGDTSPTVVTANIIVPISQTVPNTGGKPQSFTSGNWTMTAPVSSVQLPQLAGATITGLYDGNVLPPTVVPANGIVALPSPASSITLGLGYTAQLQTVYLNASENPTDQGQRKKIAGVTARVEASKGLEAGTNQVDGSTLSPPQVEVIWDSMKGIPDKGIPAYNESVVPLYTGDAQYIPLTGGFDIPGQVALQQVNPLPMNLLSLEPTYWSGDTSEQKYNPPQQRGRQ